MGLDRAPIRHREANPANAVGARVGPIKKVPLLPAYTTPPSLMTDSTSIDMHSKRNVESDPILPVLFGLGQTPRLVENTSPLRSKQG